MPPVLLPSPLLAPVPMLLPLLALLLKLPALRRCGAPIVGMPTFAADDAEDAVDSVRAPSDGRRIVEGSPSPRILRFFAPSVCAAPGAPRYICDWDCAAGAGPGEAVSAPASNDEDERRSVACAFSFSCSALFSFFAFSFSASALAISCAPSLRPSLFRAICAAGEVY